MSTIDKFTIDHHKPVDPARLHNDLNKLVTQVNENLTSMQGTISSQATTIQQLQQQLDALAKN